MFIEAMLDALKIASGILVWSIKAPFHLGVALGRLWAARVLLQESIPCSTCGTPIPQLGLWECSCSFSFYSAYFAPCPLCRAVPLFIVCGRCGASTKNYVT